MLYEVITEAFGPRGKFLHSALAAMGPDDVVELFEAEGVVTKVEATGKIFPESNKALDDLRRELLDLLARRRAVDHHRELVAAETRQQREVA